MESNCSFLFVTIISKNVEVYLCCVAGVPCQGSDNTVEVRSARDSSLY